MPEVPLYNESDSVRLAGKLDHAVLEQAFNRVVSRHEVLSSTVVLQDGEPAMLLHESWPVHLKKIDLSALAGEALESRIKQLLLEEPERPFQLLKEPGIRVTVLELGPEDHVIILMMHHLVCDRASVDVVWREWSASYSALLQGQDPQLPALTVQHGDFALWQARQLAEGRFEDDLIFWQKKLQGAPPLLELPSDRPRREANRHAGSRKNVRIGDKLVKKLRESSQQAETTLFTLFTAALNVLLFRYCGIDDIVLGVVANNRDRQEFEPAVGFLANIHALRTGLSGDSSFREVWRRVQSGLADLCRHQAAPFEEVINRVRPQQSLSFAPIVQVMMDWRDRTQTRTFRGIKGLNAVPLMSQNRTSKFDLTVFLTDEGDDVLIEVEYNSDLFDGDRMDRMLGHYGRLLESIIKNPEGRIEELEILTEREREQLLVEWNRTEREYPSGKCVHELFEEQVRRTPEAVAVVFEREELMYGELNARANQVARYLQKLGVGPEVLVGICVERSLEMVVGLLGIMKAGGAYVPFDADYPKNRLEYMLKDSGVAVLLTQKRLVGLLPVDGVKVICLDEGWPLIQKEILETPVCVAKVQNAAYMIYTSGSTGNPKGVVNIHSAIVNRLVWMQEEYQLGGADSVLQKTPFSFDVSVWEFFWPLITGARLVVASPGLHRDPESLAALIEKKGVSVVHFVPSMLSHFLEQEDIARLCRSLRQVICSGEALSLELQQRFFNKLPTRLDNLYGPTEAAVDVSCWRCEPESRLRSVPIGRPIANAELYILDRHLCPTPIGVAGELHIGGTPLARGYHNLPELTAERFILNPFRRGTGERLYKTGDLCRFLADGNIEYLGRMDHQVKLRGFRIELGEIEEVLKGCAGVREAVVVLREDEGKEKRLAAYVVGEGMTVEGMREELRRKLPEYMMPAAYQVLERLPLTANGKVDRKGLPAPSLIQRNLSERNSNPRNLIEAKLLSIYRYFLKLAQVGIDDNFFELGGNSLMAVRLVNEINKQLGVNLNIPTFYKNSTVRSIARVILFNEHKDREPKLIPLKPGNPAMPMIFIDAGVGLCRLAEMIEGGPASFATTVPMPEEFIQAAKDGDLSALPKLEAYARPHVSLIEKHLHSAKVVLVGHSFGGVLAFEVGRQLILTGRKVEMILLMDSWMSNPSWWRKLRSLDLKQVRKSLIFRCKRLRKKILHLIGHNQAEATFADNEDHQIGEVPWPLLAKIYSNAHKHYKPEPLPSRAVLFRAHETIAARNEKYVGTMGWDGLFEQGLHIVDSPGNHFTLLKEPNLQFLTHQIHEKLRKCEP